MAKHEPGALAYEISIAEDDPDTFMIYERYPTDWDLWHAVFCRTAGCLCQLPCRVLLVALLLSPAQVLLAL